MPTRQWKKTGPTLTLAVKVRPPTRSRASNTTGFSPVAFNSLAALKPADEQTMLGRHRIGLLVCEGLLCHLNN